MTKTQRSIALAIVDTSQYALAGNALLHSMKALDFAQVLVFSDNQARWGDIPIIPIPPIARMGDYNRIILKELAEHVQSDFCLVIQYDGFIINPDEFSPHFFHYDYIGAPWYHMETMDVGNGGFSWRSRKLLETVAALEYEDPSLPEDLFICHYQRPLLESAHGIRFAPKSLAAHFSLESRPVPFPTFGFHGIFHLPNVYRNSIDFLIENIDPATARRWQHHLLPAVQAVSAEAARKLVERMDALPSQLAHSPRAS